MRDRLPLLFILFIGCAAFALIYYSAGVITDILTPPSTSPVPASATKVFIIRPNETAKEIADDLARQGIIRNAQAFRIWARYRGYDKNLQAGAYSGLSPNMNIDQLIDRLQHARPNQVWVTVPEGYRATDIATIFASKKELDHFNKKEFLDLVAKGEVPGFKASFLSDKPAGASLEGYLFPQTYLVPTEATAEEVLKILVTQFGKELTPQIVASTKAHKLTIFQMVTLASLVEREAETKGDRPLIASVYYNRITTEDPNLQHLDADPTIQYALGSWAPLKDDPHNLVPDSPYNTYTHTGWPPTPIASPGLDSLVAAANPAKTAYFFFVAKNDGSHSHAFARTLDEQIRNQQKYQSKS